MLGFQPLYLPLIHTPLSEKGSYCIAQAVFKLMVFFALVSQVLWLQGRCYCDQLIYILYMESEGGDRDQSKALYKLGKLSLSYRAFGFLKTIVSLCSQADLELGFLQFCPSKCWYFSCVPPWGAEKYLYIVILVNPCFDYDLFKEVSHEIFHMTLCWYSKILGPCGFFILWLGKFNLYAYVHFLHHKFLVTS